MSWRPRLDSLQARLLVLLLALLGAVWLGVAALTWRDASHELDELLDGHLAQAAALLVVQQAAIGDGEDDEEDEEDEVPDAPTLHRYAPRVAFQVFHEGRLVRRSAQVGSQPMSARASGFETVTWPDGSRWRVFAARGTDHDIQVYVAEQLRARRAILRGVLRGVLLPLALALPLLAVVLWWAVRRGLAPLRDIRDALVAREPLALTPIDGAQAMPAEIAPLLDALNALFERIAQMLEAERRCTADAAHELRTPIAAIRAQAQVALGAGDDARGRQQALQATLAGCDRATHLVEQLLQLARLETPPPAEAAVATTTLRKLAAEVAAELAPMALAAGQTLSLEADEALAQARARGSEHLWRMLLRNLLDNALRYSPAGAQVVLALSRDEGGLRLTVEDSGPGLDEAQRARLGERFFRVLGSEHAGSGLGWSIVRRVAQAVGAGLEVDRSARLGGLRVTVRVADADGGPAGDAAGLRRPG